MAANGFSVVLAFLIFGSFNESSRFIIFHIQITYEAIATVDDFAIL